MSPEPAPPATVEKRTKTGVRSEDRDVVADQVEIAFLGVELCRKAAHVARHVARTGAARDGREAHEDRRLLAGALQEIGPRYVAQRLIGLEIAVRAGAAGVHDAL